MLIAEARIETERSSQYLVRLCGHVGKAARARAGMPAHVECSVNHGIISLGRGRCTLRAEPGVLTLQAEAPDEGSLRELEQRVEDRLERFGRRDHLTVTWNRPWGAAERSLEKAAGAPHTGGRAHG